MKAYIQPQSEVIDICPSTIIAVSVIGGKADQGTTVQVKGDDLFDRDWGTSSIEEEMFTESPFE